MTQIEMEQLLENLDRRLARVEQKLPTLATKEDLERFATKQDLERFATKEEFEESKRFALMLNEATRDDIRIVAEGVAALAGNVRDITAQLTSLTERLEQNGVI